MNETKGDDLPYDLGISFADFEEYKDEWILWRTLGYYTENGIWVAPISFQEAEVLPKRKLDAFFVMDSLLEIIKRQKFKRKPNKPPRK